MHSGIYIHIPFCESKCGYCDFFSITDLEKVNEFFSALEKEILMYSNEYGKEKFFDTIYIGGGTPSVLSANQIDRLLNLLYENYTITNDAEVTIEINPGTVNQSKLIDLKKVGINRLSIGVQSFSENELQFLGRIHNANESEQSVQYAKEAGFEKISIDLIYALPNQSMANWESTLIKAVELNPEHISAYNLTIEKGTPFFELKKKGTLKPLSELIEKDFFNFTDLQLTEVGYNHYEVSSFARGEENKSKHNSKYWQRNFYLGFGPSAHSFWNDERWGNTKSVEKYIDKLNKNEKPVEIKEKLSTKDLEFEHIFLSLRTYNGLSLNEFQGRFKSDFKKKYQSIFLKLIDANYAEISETDFKLTKKGMALCDEILPAFIKN